MNDLSIIIGISVGGNDESKKKITDDFIKDIYNLRYEDPEDYMVPDNDADFGVLTNARALKRTHPGDEVDRPLEVDEFFKNTTALRTCGIKPPIHNE